MDAFLRENLWVIIGLVIWTLPWKGVALWMAARRKDTAWFVILLLVNAVGILEILYIFAFSKRKSLDVQSR